MKSRKYSFIKSQKNKLPVLVYLETIKVKKEVEHRMAKYIADEIRKGKLKNILKKVKRYKGYARKVIDYRARKNVEKKVREEINKYLDNQ